MTPPPLLSVRDLTKSYASAAGWFAAKTVAAPAVDRVNFDVMPGETLGLVGESGSGKSTIGRAVTMLSRPDSGRVLFEGQDLATLAPAALRELRQKIQIIFQDPFSALNPRMRVGDFVAEPLIIHDRMTDRGERERHIARLFERVGLDPSFMDRFPHEFSGGQRQRICIARAIVLGPRLIVADEPIASLDMSIQAQIINLMQDLQDEFGLSYLFISHDLRMIRHLCHRVAVLFKGRVVETGSTEQIYEAAAHPYTQRLLSAIPEPDPDTERHRSILPASTFNAAAELAEIAPGHFAAL